MSAIKRVDCNRQNMRYYLLFFFWITKHQTGMEHEMCDGGRQRKLFYSVSPTLRKFPGADPGFFLGGGALVSCSTSTPINHIVFFWRIPVVSENCRSSQGGEGGCAPPAPSP